MRKIFTFLAAILFATNIFLSPIASAATLTFEQINPQVEGYVASLPTAKKAYKSSQRPILIQGAMTAEVGNLINALKNPVVYWHMHYLFVAGTYKNYPVVVSRTGVGMENAAASTVLAIEKFNPIAVINQGTAGGYLPNLHVNDIVIGDSSINYSAYKEEYSPAGEYDITKQTLRGISAYDKDNKESTEFRRFSDFKPDERLLQAAKTTAALNKNWNVTPGTIGSADSWNNAIDHIAFLRDNYGVACEEMETNAVAQMCHTADIPFIGIRIISDNAVTGEDFELASALPCQDFVLLVTEKLIRDIKAKRF
ncbi:MAG: 5'-methylthioadenosine/S-adenosylhomocysteine nucleosidase [Selenomonadaceae bacterium]|nr:5'-methylthioadenosine/S-adenosylhomocysteine nucleosidase [Selenomonadaceae bacterium]